MRSPYHKKKKRRARPAPSEQGGQAPVRHHRGTLWPRRVEASREMVALACSCSVAVWPSGWACWPYGSDGKWMSVKIVVGMG